jgi:hypothetical protein
MSKFLSIYLFIYFLYSYFNAVVFFFFLWEENSTDRGLYIYRHFGYRVYIKYSCWKWCIDPPNGKMRWKKKRKSIFGIYCINWTLWCSTLGGREGGGQARVYQKQRRVDRVASSLPSLNNIQNKLCWTVRIKCRRFPRLSFLKNII